MTPVLDLPAWTPTVQDVALNLLARTLMPNGTLAGTFNSQTTPTDVQVMAIIQQQVRLHAPKLGDVSDDLADSAGALLALRAAIVVERSFFQEQIGTPASPYRDLCEEAKVAQSNWEDVAQGNVPNGWRTAALPIGTEYPGYATGTY